MNILQRFIVWRERRYWEKRHLEYLRVLIQCDDRWLAHDPIADALTTRYLKALSSDWYKTSHEVFGQ